MHVLMRFCQPADRSFVCKVKVGSHVKSYFICLFQSVITKEDKKKQKAEVKFVSYGVGHSKEKSGAYLFLPDGPAQVVNVYFLYPLPTAKHQGQ